VCSQVNAKRQVYQAGDYGPSPELGFSEKDPGTDKQEGHHPDKHDEKDRQRPDGPKHPEHGDDPEQDQKGTLESRQPGLVI
jgi:hypothetical protein